LHSFLGTENDVDSVLEEKNRRSINRSILNKSKLDQTLCNPESTTYKIFNQLAKIIQIRTKEKSFHPNADQNIIDLGPSIFSLIRTSMEKTERILCITNVTDKVEKINLNLSKMGLQTYKFQELITNRNIQSTGEMLSLTVDAYEILWLKFMN
jgi:sucrose phosphorylase